MNRPIETPGTTVSAFIGLAPGGPLDIETPTTFDGWGTDEDALWEGIHARPLGDALRSFFENGGATAVAVAVEDAGSASVRAGLAALDAVDLVNLVVLPAESAGSEDAREIVAEAAAFCERRRAMLLVDPPPGWTDVPAIEAALAGGLEAAVGTTSPNAALYLPRLHRSDPAQAAAGLFSPAGAVAGVIARTDAAEGAWDAPAGLDAEILGADGLEFDLDRDDAHALNSAGVSTLRMFPGRRRPIVWGARTLAGADVAASEWKYVPVRRTALLLEESIERGLQWTRSEPNDEPLWQSVRELVGTFLHELFRKGAFQGRTDRDAYFVTCDRDTMTQHERATGDLVVRVGFAPMKPAEFVVLTIRATALPPT
ncbi:phage tail sheath family protein [Agromyces humatus]|uniref:Phage tail sheath family protein n=1 Tax=Agromyces humatus TaxID=279573 RepID=A0ABP4WD45_9MICO|nr:phage tail sheath subtilisin-like domain-containing protein [Agromyces humatus]